MERQENMKIPVMLLFEYLLESREATIPYLARVCESQLRFALISSGLKAWADAAWKIVRLKLHIHILLKSATGKG
jgi:hypothetical protein